METEARTCVRCHALLTAAGGRLVCPACALEGALLGDDAPDQPAEDEGFPRRFGDYQLLGEIGRGGVGLVFKARQLSLGRVVALKVLLYGSFADKSGRRRFHAEAEAAARLQHPNIVAVHEVGEQDGVPYLTMDFVDGPDLGRICGGRPLPVPTAAQFLFDISRAIQAAHAAGVLHRDLKPSNILVGADGRPRVTDFGLAKRDDASTSLGLTSTGQALGSPSYAPPEQAAGRLDQVGPASDVYGLGAILYHLVTGRAPFVAATATQTLRLVLDTDPAPPRLLNPALPRDLETICLKCLSKEPARRYATAAEVAEDVERFLHERPIRARPPNVLYRLWKFAQRHRTAVAATAAVFIALAAGLGFALIGFRHAIVQQRATDDARGQAEQLIGLMTQDLKPMLEQRGGLPELLKMTEATIHYFETLPAELRNTKTDRGHADALARMVRLRGLSLNDRKGAEETLNATLALREKIVRENPDDPEAAAALLWDEWERPRATGDQILYGKAEWHAGFYRRWQELSVRFPASLRVKRCLAEVAALYADKSVASDQTTEAIAAANRSKKLVEELLAASPDDESLGELVFVSERALASTYGAVRDNAKMAETAEETLTRCTSALQKDPANLNLRRRVAEAARSLSYKAYQVSPKRGRDAELIAREHFRVLMEANPGDLEIRARFAMTHLMESLYLATIDAHRADARVALRKFDALLGALPERTADIDPAPFRFRNTCYLAQLAAEAGEIDQARVEIREARTRLDLLLARLPAGTFDFHLARARALQELLWSSLHTKDWPELIIDVEETTVAIEAGLRAQPGNVELVLRQAEMPCYRGIVLRGMGRTAEAIVVLQEATAHLRTIPRASQVYDVEILQRAANFALIRALAQRGDTTRALALAGSLLTAPNPPTPENWYAKEWQARARVFVASQLGPNEASRRTELLDVAEKILTAPEAADRITAWGREDLATIARLRAELETNSAPDVRARFGL